MFYEVAQNNTGGSFVTNDKLCHRLIIEADSESEANDIAESLGCYWNGVSDGYDCECCGDRWYGSSLIDIESYRESGYTAYVYERDGQDIEQEWIRKFGDYPVKTLPMMEKRISKYSTGMYSGLIYFEDIVQYAQFMTDSYGGWTTPDIRIFYKDGSVKDINKKECVV